VRERERERDREALIIKKPWPSRAVAPWEENYNSSYY
jgi:hypothetical protein